MLKQIIDNVRTNRPLIHNITNYVTVNDCANILLACGGSPIMADDIDEVEEITSVCDGLTINIGTLNKRTIPAMILAGKRANELGHPVVLDPVGAGASSLRTKTAMELMDSINFTVIRGNISEIKTLALGRGTTKGVDADAADSVTEENLEQMVLFAREFAKKTNAVIVITGAIDIIAGREKAFCIYNGHPMMSSITGTGCQLSALIAAYITANPENVLDAAAAAVCAMGICGEKAYERMAGEDGNATYRNYIIDAVCHLSGEELNRRARYKIVRCTGEMLRLYAVTDQAWVGKQTLTEQVESALKGGATCIQLREKNLDQAAFFEEAAAMKTLCRQYRIPLIINDDVAVAVKSGADGVHVGQKDMDVSDVRMIAGKDMIIGVSVQTVEQAVAAERDGADYLGVGAVFSTATKPDAKPVPLETVKEICETVTIPVVAIGGISKNNISELKGLQLDGVAMVSAVFAAENIEEECKKLLLLSEEMVRNED